MSGGSDVVVATADSAEVIITRDTTEFESLPPMPYLSNFHCIAAIYESLIFATGLGENNDLSFMYIKDSEAWSPMPNMPSGRQDMGCGVFRAGVGKPEVVVVGGSMPDPPYYLDVVEIFSVEQETWRTGT